ncbi:hypothetical protein HANVADRAFT_51328 [Hanseniaspora valbyensis NRRL Y-1626]|uniref:Protein HGH1 homolog n=1 Tax=Hanseniaspora valbyensis NRRL Y-1626 TaxID=766949 RepID=A0A1B7TJH1_9ASCO|nr:hypothetical protein HANVADRAFT_51328 [Hanseniaspora valbyensis NRRL Y-1626]
MPSEIEELVSFLHSEQPVVKQIALQNLVGFSQQPAIFKYDNNRAVQDLKDISKMNSQIMVQQSITILTNLCNDDELRREIICQDKDYLKYLAWKIVDLANTSADLMCILLSNLAKDEGVLEIFNINEIHKDVQNIDKDIFKSDRVIDCLMDCFVKGFDRTLNKYANFNYLAYFFADISRFRIGRDYFISLQDYDDVIPLQKLLPFNEKFEVPEDKVRREGVAYTIKNSLFDSEKHFDILSNEVLNLLPFLLSPIVEYKDQENLSDEEMFNLPDELQFLEEDKKREPEHKIILVYLESILLLCTLKQCRDYLREKSVYPLIRELHKRLGLENNDIEETCNRVVNMLMRDEIEGNAVEDVIMKSEDINPYTVEEKEEELKLQKQLENQEDDSSEDEGLVIVA